MPMPWTSKSKLMTMDYCPYKYYLQYIKKKKFRERRKTLEGTNMHMVFAKFYEQIEPKHIFKDEFMDGSVYIRNHPLRHFIYEVCMRFVKPDQREYGKYKNIIANFATIETKRFLRLNRIMRDKNKIFTYFKPLYLEKRLEYEPLKLFGTIDRVNAMITPSGSKKIAIYDYKTGNVPRDVINSQEIAENSVSPFKWKLPSSKMKEIHFYVLLYALSAGYELKQPLKEFLMSPTWWYVKKEGMSYKETLDYKRDYITSLQDDYKLYKDGKLVNKGDFIVGYYFVNGAERVGKNKYIPKAYRPIKQFNYRSLKSVYLAINELRSIWYNKYYQKQPDKKKYCKYKNCNLIDTFCHKED